MSPTRKKAEVQELRYAAAMEELEHILQELEDDRIDVDQLAAKVKRASELIQLCRERLTKTQLEIEQVVADLEGVEPETGEKDDEQPF